MPSGSLLSINADEIVGNCIIHKRDASSPIMKNSSSNSSVSKSFNPFTAVRIESADRVKQILFNKRCRNYYSTKDIDKTILNQDLLSRLPSAKIFINNVFSTNEYKTC